MAPNNDNVTLNLQTVTLYAGVHGCMATTRQPMR